MRISDTQYNAGLAVIVALGLIFGVKGLLDGLRSSTALQSAANGYELFKGAAPAAEAPAAPAAKAAEAKPAADAKPAAGKEAAAAAPAAAPAAPAAAFDVAMIAKANADNGKTVFKKCGACHVADKAAASGVGPNLWGVVGRARASREDFAAKYSGALKDKGGDWGYAELAEFIENPGAALKGTKMSFPGIKDPAAVADLLAFLRTQADTPAALP